MRVRTFFWHDRVWSKSKYMMQRILGRKSHLHFLAGNAGDIFTRDIIRSKYGVESWNLRGEKDRLLCVGSIAHSIMPGDVVCGIGTKGSTVPSPSESPCVIYGLRGPITYEAFKKAGHDLSQLRFLKDPGLLLRFLVKRRETKLHTNKVIFIPHYRERGLHKSLPKGIEFVDIDSHPLKLAKKINSAALVYSSSLHGIIFAHALNRPCVFVKPQTEEPLLKYEDYYASVEIDFKKPIDSIYVANFQKAPDSPPDLKYKAEDFYFPSAAFLKEKGIMR